MKKLVLSFALVLAASMVSGQQLTKEQIKAQKKEAKALMLKAKEADKAIIAGDNAGALNTIQPVLASPLTNSDAYVWYVACKAKKGVIDGENYKRSQGQQFNADLMYNSAYDIFDYLIKCDELDKAPNAKGKVAPKYSMEIVQMMYENRNQLFNGGAYFYNAEKYDEAFKQFDMFIKTSTLEPLDTLPAVKDVELNANAAYYAALCGMQTENYKNVLAHIDLAMNEPSFKENAMKYKAMSQAQVGDTVAWIQTLKDGAKTFPGNPYFYQCLIAYYQLKNQPDQMTAFADEMIASDPENPLFFFVKGMVLQESGKTAEAVEWYKKTLAKDPNYEGALANLGICYTVLAQEYSQKSASTNIKDKAQIKKDKEIINGYFQEALPLYEKLRKLQPNKTELWITGLSNCYYNLNMDKELKEIESLIPNE
ncbi:MAG: hypothetical protein IKU35_00750 [Bacteroidaceae bacterium]|nr:hypothetical protein [Bacteroidaceae bacterium]